MDFSSLYGHSAEGIKMELDKQGMLCSSFGFGYPDLKNKTAEDATNTITIGSEFERVVCVPQEKPF